MSKDSSISEWPQFSSEVMRQGPAIRKAHMTSLVRLLKDEQGLQTVNILEVGSWAGASTITWARAIKDLGLSGSVHCVDIWEPYFDLEANKAEIYEKMNRAAEHGVIFEEFRRNIAAAGVEHIVTITKGNSRDILPILPENSYQIVFIDGSHLYADIYRDIIQAKRLVADDGIICGDDLELSVEAVDQAAHRKNLVDNVDFTEDPSTGVSYHPGVSQAIADAFGEVSVWDGLWAVRRTRKGFETINDLEYEPQIPEHLNVGEKNPLAEVVRSELGFNIIRSQGSYIACRESLGVVDFSLPLNALTRAYASSDLFVASTLEDALLRLCELTISSLRSEIEAKNSAKLLESHLGFNIIYCQDQYAACRQSLGPVRFSDPLRDLSQMYPAEDFFIETTRDRVLLRICEIEQARLNRIIADRDLR
ncbi:putative O-methyltransferase YrrM [Bradyrhizobium japonicum]|uniref:class I SAM-dependent methyltransferase n=1 Tax=Bradyrhizobium japonicum TaxID=375 RepID=UPI0033961D6C